MTNQETVPLDLIKQNTRLAKLLTTGLISGIIAAILNIIYMNLKIVFLIKTIIPTYTTY